MPSKFTIPLGAPTDARVRVLGAAMDADFWQGAAAAGAGASVTRAVQVARELCTRTLSSLDGGDPNVARWAALHFLLDAPGLTQHRATIRAVIEATGNGLQAHNLIKVDRLSENGMQGFVKQRDPPDDAELQLAALLGERKHVNSVVIPVHQATGGTVPRRVSPIHVASSLTGKPLDLVQTIIHEATHRYAGTHDAILNGARYGYLRDGTEWITPGITRDLALRNADSYGWFVVKVGKAFEGLIPGIAH